MKDQGPEASKQGKKGFSTERRRFGHPRVDILLATYNGEPWLSAQIDSLLAQDYRNWQLLIRDDGSSDATRDILQDRIAALDGRARLLEGGDNLGSCGNFLHLLQASEADYVMFCDQDDVWLPEKVRVTLDKMRDLEATCGRGTPLLVHTDLKVVDQDLNLVAESGHAYQGIDPVKGAVLNRLLVQNVVSGCTVMVNRALCRVALPVPAEVPMHDHWLALVAAGFGQIGYLPQATMLYRQHEINRVGAQRWTPGYAAGLLLQLPALRRIMARNRRQAELFHQRYARQMEGSQAETLEAFIRLPSLGPLNRRRAVVRHGFFYCGTVRNLGWLLLC